MASVCRQHGIKVVLLGRSQPDVKSHAFTCDNYGGGREIARYLLSLGRKKIAFLAGIKNTSTHTERARGFRDVLNEAGQSIQAEAVGQYDYAIAFKAATELFRRKVSLDAMVCCNEIMALAAIDAANERGMKVGEDIAIIGFDDIPMASWNSYRLTTVSQPVEEMVSAAISAITDTDRGAKASVSIQIFPGAFIKRTSA